MSEALSESRAVAAVKFKWQKDERTYDYFIPEGMDLTVGQKVMVETKRGETEVEVMAIKPESELAEKAVIRVAEAKPAETTKSEGWDF